MTPKKEKEETIEDIRERVQDSENDSDLILEKDMRIEMKKDNTNQSRTDIVPRDHVVLKLDAYLSEDGLNIGKNDYCYVKIVGNHLEIGRAKIVLEE